MNVITNSAAFNSPAAAAAAVEAYQTNKMGPLTLGGTQVLGWEKLPRQYRSQLSLATQKTLNDTFPADWPDLEFLHDSTRFTPEQRQHHHQPHQHVRPPIPLINRNYLSPPRRYRNSHYDFQTPGAFLVRPTSAKSPSGLKRFQAYLSVQTDAHILQFIKEAMAPVRHAAATFKMGSREGRHGCLGRLI